MTHYFKLIRRLLVIGSINRKQRTKEVKKRESMEAKKGISTELFTIIHILLHIMVGILLGYFLLHPITMAIFWFEINNTSVTLQSLSDAFSEGFMHAFHLHMMSMSLVFMLIGGIIGLGSGLYFSKIHKQKSALQIKQHQLNNSFEKLEKLNMSLEEKVAKRTKRLKEANESLETLNLKLLNLDRVKTEFLGLISHEIRTPLNGIIGPLELLKATFHAPDIDHLLDILDISVKRLEKFALNALLITRLKTQQIEKKDSIHLLNLISEVLYEENEKFQKGNIQVKKNNEITPWLISGETELIKKCISNILDNAINFSPKDGTIEIRTYNEDHTVICEIKDNGRGFVPGANDQVFDLFTTGDEYKDNCVGLGLSMVKMIMELHGGSIIIGNNPEGGASVKLLFMQRLEE